MAEANIKAVITADDKASSVLKGFGDHVSSVGSKVAGVAEVAAKATLAAGAAAVAFGVMSVKAYQDSANVQAQLNSVLTSTNHAAGIQIDTLNKQAQALQSVTRFSDEQVNAGQAMLLTFTNIRGEVFNRTIPTLLDLSTAMHQDLQTSAIQVGKALNDPITGISSLHRIGVTFSDTQKQQIQNFVDTNNVAAAQGVILDELQKEFGGSAQAAGATFGGQLEILKNKLNDVQEQVGSVIVNALTPFIVKAADFLLKIDWTAVINNTIGALQRFWGTITTVYNTLANYLIPGISRLIEIVVRVAEVVNAWIVPSLLSLWSTISDRLLPQLRNLWNTLEPGLTRVLQVVAVVIGAAVVGALWIFINALNVAISIVGGLIRVINIIVGWFGNAGGAAINAGHAIGSAFSAAAGPINAIANAIRTVIDLAQSAINAVKSIPNPVSGAGNFLSGITSHLPHFAEGGVVPGHIGQPQLAVVHGGETVIPTSGGGAGGTINININAGAYMGSQIEARKYASSILTALKDVAASKNMSVEDLMRI